MLQLGRSRPPSLDAALLGLGAWLGKILASWPLWLSSVIRTRIWRTKHQSLQVRHCTHSPITHRPSTGLDKRV